MPQHLANAGRHPRRSGPQWILALAATVFLAAPASAVEAPPSYVTEWALTGLPGVPAFPYHGTVNQQGNLYVAQVSPQRVTVYDGAGTLQFAWEVGNFGCAALAIGVAVDAANNAYVTDLSCNRVQKYDANRQFVTLWGGKGSTDGKFERTAGVALDLQGNVLVVDMFNHRIQKFSPDGTFLSKWGSLGSAPGQFDTPTAIGVATDGKVYVLDSINQRVQVFDEAGNFISAFGEPATALTQPWGMALDALNNVYVADTGGDRVVKFDSQGAVLTKWGGSGRGPGQFVQPHGVAVDAAGNVYVMDSGNARVQKFAPSQAVIVALVVEPRTINIQGGGKWVLAHIEPSAPYTPADISVASLSMNGVAVDPAAPVDIGDWNGNGVADLTVRFLKSAIVATASPGAQTLALTLTGSIGGASLLGSDVVRLVNGLAALGSDRVAQAFDAPGAENTLALRGVTPNPATAGGGLVVRLSLPRATPARLEVIDLGGRRVLREDLAGLGQGAHQIALGGTRRLQPGVYWVRLTQGEEWRQARFAVVQ